MVSFIPRSVVVLVVEDEALIRSTAVSILQEMHWDYHEAPHAAHAIHILERQSNITALFTDIHMPGEMDGLKLAFEVTRRWPRIGILITSGRAKPTESQMPSGALFLSKPYSDQGVRDGISALSH